MSDRISEAEWRVLRELKPIALERFCQRVLSEVAHLTSDTGKSAHERYLAVFKLIRRRDDELADAFDDLRRSTAMRRLACIKFHELLTEEELAHFSPETRDLVEFLTATLPA
jgi:hypothetical protein